MGKKRSTTLLNCLALPLTGHKNYAVE